VRLVDREGARALPRPRVPCDYFVACERPAEGVVRHEVAGLVPTCARCAELAGMDLQPFSDR
jgi:hypothetical protein